MPSMTELDFQGRYKDKIMQQWPRSNVPHMKRIINQQVFLEETDPYVYEDGRRNWQAMEAAQHMLAGAGGLPGDLSGLQLPQPGMNLPSLGPLGAGPDQSAMFSLPKFAGQQYQSVGPHSGANVSSIAGPNIPPTSYMTQGEYSQHPIFRS